MQNAASTDPRGTNYLEDFIALRCAGSDSQWVSTQLSGKRVLITGAGGSIGSALARAVWAAAPASLILLDTSENALYQVDRSLHEAGSHSHIACLSSISNQPALSHLFQKHQPQIVFHAAALKHVPLMEQNPFAAIENNALGTLALTQAAISHGVEQFVLVSTDKAVDPLSIMGASKRIAELILLTLDSGSTHMTAVRLCNVIGSQGSVLPLFLDQMARGGPLTVTHRDAHRYFITLDRAIEALFVALQPRSNSTILIPDPVAPVRILDLAQHLLLTHASPAVIEFTGLRPGDKLTERLLSSRERLVSQSTLDRSILRAVESPASCASTLDTALSDLREATQMHNLRQLIRSVRVLVPEYQPSALIDASLIDLEATTEVCV